MGGPGGRSWNERKPTVTLQQNPLISVILPTFNTARVLPEAIASIRQQSYEPLEIILVDDGSTDETKSLAERWPDVRYLHQPNQGSSAARNTGYAPHKAACWPSSTPTTCGLPIIWRFCCRTCWPSRSCNSCGAQRTMSA